MATGSPAIDPSEAMRRKGSRPFRRLNGVMRQVRPSPPTLLFAVRDKDDIVSYRASVLGKHLPKTGSP